MIKLQICIFIMMNGKCCHDISVQLPQGSITGLIGPNGAGKSTLMRCMAGLENPSSGKVLLDGQPVFRKSSRELCQIRLICLIFLDCRRILLFWNV